MTTVPNWSMPSQYEYRPMHPESSFVAAPFGNDALDPNSQAYLFPGSSDYAANVDQWYPQTQQPWDMDAGSFATGLNQMQQEELMHNLETDGMERIQSKITSTLEAMWSNPTRSDEHTFDDSLTQDCPETWQHQP